MATSTNGRAVVAGGAGFVGSHLVDRLFERGADVVVLDDFSSGSAANLAHLGDSITLIEHDVCQPLPELGPVSLVCHLASPASPPDYLARPIETLDVGSIGTRNLLELARVHGARFMITSTSEVYGDPEVHPQPESYWGNVNPIGPRSVYDESKRFAEALTVAYGTAHGVDVRIARLFNTYGPRLRPADGRVISNFVTQAFDGVPLTVFGDGTQTRSFAYVDDTVAGLLALIDGDVRGPINLGNPGEFSVLELVEIVRELFAPDAAVEFLPLPADDPTQRKPDISLAKEALGWEPKVPLRDGLRAYADWLRTQR